MSAHGFGFRRFHPPDAAEIKLQLLEQRALGTTQHIGDQGAGMRQHLAGEIVHHLERRHNGQLVGLSMAGRERVETVVSVAPRAFAS